jgi:hypothetical protein
MRKATSFNIAKTSFRHGDNERCREIAPVFYPFQYDMDLANLFFWQTKHNVLGH